MLRIIRVRGIIFHDGMYLFVRHAPQANFWALPGGKLDAGESLQDGLSRELYEELGIKPNIGRLLYVQQLFKNQEESLEFFFEVTNGYDYLAIDLDATSHGAAEIADVGFIHPRQEDVLPTFLKQLPLDGKYAASPGIFVQQR